MPSAHSHRDKVFVITGGAGGLGSGIATALVASGAGVVLCDLPGERLTDTADSLGAPERVWSVGLDVSNELEARGALRKALDAAGQVDGLVACAGIIQTAPFSELTAADWNRVLTINLTGTFHVLQSVANHLRDRAAGGGDGGSIVLFSSDAGRSGRSESAHYAASKAAVLSLTKSAALAYSPNVRVNAVCPGVFLTHMWDDIIAQRVEKFGPGAGEDYKIATTSRIPLGRTGRVEELASVVTFLLGSESSYVTGQAINVDGGLEMN
jgi:NAD(P)-dependent dehydrogenase (short-subunit alcohol dehydrogenase family)